jgi:hypothetical protein
MFLSCIPVRSIDTRNCDIRYRAQVLVHKDAYLRDDALTWMGPEIRIHTEYTFDRTLYPK